MAENIEGLGFSIENTFDTGMGDTQLINDLFSPESATAAPEKLEEIVKEVKPPEKSKKPEVEKGKEIVQKEEGEEFTDRDLLKNLLGEGEEESEEEEEVEKPSEEDIPEESQFSALTKDLLKLGVFTEDEDEPEIKTPEEFLERFNSEKKKGAIELLNNFVGKLGDDYQKAFEAIFVNGVNPKEYFELYEEIVNFAELDLTNEANQERVIRQSLTNSGLEPEDIKDEIDRLRNYGDLETTAQRHHKVLIKGQAKKLQEAEEKAAQELQQKEAIKTQYIQNVQSVLQERLKAKEFDGIPLNPKLADELQDFLLIDKWRTPSGETLTDFDKAILDLKKNPEMKVKVALLLKTLEKDPTLSTIKRSGVTQKSDKLFEEVVRQKSKTVTNVKKPSGSWFQ